MSWQKKEDSGEARDVEDGAVGGEGAGWSIRQWGGMVFLFVIFAIIIGPVGFARGAVDDSFV